MCSKIFPQPFFKMWNNKFWKIHFLNRDTMDESMFYIQYSRTLNMFLCLCANKMLLNEVCRLYKLEHFLKKKTLRKLHHEYIYSYKGDVSYIGLNNNRHFSVQTFKLTTKTQVKLITLTMAPFRGDSKPNQCTISNCLLSDL